MRIFIPAIGDRVILTAPWEFDLPLDSRNVKFADTKELLSAYKLLSEDKNALYSEGKRWNSKTKKWDGKLLRPKTVYGEGYKVATVGMILPAGTILECDGVCIRSYSKGYRGNNDYINWKIMVDDKKTPLAMKPARNQKFRVSLDISNQIECELISRYRDRELVSRYRDRK